MVEITSEEQNKVKRMKKKNQNTIVSEISGTISNAPMFKLKGSQKKKRKRKGMRKILKRLLLKFFPTWRTKESIKSKRHQESHTG